MDELRFDSLARALEAGQSRRQLGRLPGRLALGGPLGFLVGRESEARKRKRKWTTRPPSAARALVLTSSGGPMGSSSPRMA